MTDKIGTLIIDVADKTLSAEDREILAHPLVGGVILFTRNYDSREQLTHLCQQIRQASQHPLLIMVDQEGGRVQRFISEFTRLPPMDSFGQLYDNNPQAACRLAQECGWLMATELLSVGIDLSFAPVLDLNKGLCSVIGDRSFHADPEVVIMLASAFIRGMQEAGMAATGKHFPGHGAVTLDSHLTLPVDDREMSEIEQTDMLPFTHLVNAGMSAVMAAHIVFPRVDALPVGFSRVWLHDILRKRLGFTGVLFSDDLHMEGANISANYADRMLATKEAGCDFALICNYRPGVIQVLDNVAHATHLLDKEKWGILQGQFTPPGKAMHTNQRWQAVQERLLDMTN